MCFSIVVVGIHTVFEDVYKFQSFVILKLIQWSSVVALNSDVKGSSFRRLRKIANSDYYLRHSVRPHGPTRLLVDGF
jgi:hypothetical protein